MITGVLFLSLSLSMVACVSGNEMNQSSQPTPESSQPDSSQPDSSQPDSSNTKNQESAGAIYSLKEVYETGGISKHDLLSIAYYNSDKKINEEQMGEDFMPVPQDEELDSAVELKIREAMAELYRTRETNPKPNTTAEDIFIVQYYGCYNGFHAFRYSDAFTGYFTWTVPYTMEVAGVKFEYYDSISIAFYKEV